ncbi:facilitated trehalose transporter Tret1-2 homolog isoform X1 [Neodiprion pinetum]|uniref:facilitated trehalose transporter Tret1-2 homolog isoform X1 n=1 Tax=Neodiprion pinetum TaxID=441929 RepID=UPI001EDC9456|nr:facilitated trehalose transporter Tret1-2 homolog isoform X1 [Neodiprion pinetum]XP_046466302.1 facilitated trehalose transporter Tret1-2 homolog isoform X1 [Neodiprion pinetum]
MNSSFVFRQMLIAITCTLVMFDNGFQDGWATPSIPELESEDSNISVTGGQISWIIAFLHVGIAVGPFVAFYLMEKIGRKWTLVCSAVPKILAWILIAFAPNYWVLYLARFLAGIGSGITLTVTPIYIGEVADKKMRGPMSTTIAVMINVGTLVVYAIGLYVSRMTLALTCLSVPIIFLLTFIWMPESPMYLVKNKRITDAEMVLKWSLVKENVEDELEEIKRYVYRDDDTKQQSIWKNAGEIVSRRGNRKALRITLICFSGLMLSGNVPVLSYQAEIFKRAHLNISTNFSVIGAGLSLVVAGWVCVSIVKFTGKRTLLLISAPFTAFFLAAIALYFTLEEYGVEVDSVNWIPMVCMVGYVVFYALGLDSMAYAYQGEVFPDNVKALSAMICSLFYAILGVVTVQLFQILWDNYDIEVPLWVFAGFTTIMWAIIYVIVPETEGKSLEVIQRELHEEKTTKQIISRASSLIFT